MERLAVLCLLARYCKIPSCDALCGFCTAQVLVVSDWADDARLWELIECVDMFAPNIVKSMSQSGLGSSASVSKGGMPQLCISNLFPLPDLQ